MNRTNCKGNYKKKLNKWIKEAVAFSGKNHIKFCLFSLAVFYISRYLQGYLALDIYDLVFCMGSLLGCLLPDIDHPQALAGDIIPAHKITKHMGITHTLFFNSLFIIIPYIVLGELHDFFTGISFGYFTHLFTDHIDGNKLKHLYWPIRSKPQPKKKRK